MGDEAQQIYMMSVEIRILASIMARVSTRAVNECFTAQHADLSGLQYGILRTLMHGSSTLSELSRLFVLDPSTLVPVIDALERKDLVARGKDAADRRRVPISLTPGGIELLRSVPLQHENDLLYQCLNRLGEPKAQQLQTLLREVIAQMPEGNTMLDSVASRLYNVHGEKFTNQASCDIYHRGEINPDDEPRLYDKTDA